MEKNSVRQDGQRNKVRWCAAVIAFVSLPPHLTGPIFSLSHAYSAFARTTSALCACTLI